MENILFYGAGLKELGNNLIENWIGPIFIVAVAVYAIVLLKDKEFRKLIAFLVFAIVVGLMVYFGSELFGKSGSLTKSAKELTSGVGGGTAKTNTILVVPVEDPVFNIK